MNRIIIPDYVNTVAKRLEEHGHECFIVGGCVRDALSGKKPHDFDMTTSATPDEMIVIFSDMTTIPTGLKHGTITVVSEGHNLEITTFRTDGDYLDNRHPSSVNFSRNLGDDLSRRDFTVNAMAYSERTGLVDLFGGCEDLENGIIRCVGDPDKRFAEDGLRIIRGLRFASVLGFEIEEKTSASIEKNRGLLLNIASERLLSELRKLICGIKADEVLAKYYRVFGVIIPELLPCVGFDQKNPHHSLDVYGHTLLTLKNCDAGDKVLRFAALFHDIGKPKAFTVDENGIGHFPDHAKLGAEITDTVLRRLRASNELREKVVRLVAEHTRQIEPTEKSVKRFLASHGEEDARRAFALRIADRLACAEGFRDTSDTERVASVAEAILAEKACLNLGSLAVKGQDMTALGLRGREIGAMLSLLLDRVIDGDLENDREILIEYAEKCKSQVDTNGK